MAKGFFTSIFILFSFYPSFAQGLDSLLQIQRQADPREKIYVHFDKQHYNAGETIWFKAYLFTGNFPSDVSTNFYAELVDEKGLVISRRTAPVLFSGATGSFDIDSGFSGDVLYFKAYTVSILNSDSGFHFQKAIRVISHKATAMSAVSPLSDSHISFLPEGGDWVNGLPTVMAFKATDTYGMPRYISGTITDGAGVKVTDLQTVLKGMGSFLLTPEEGKTYVANWKDEQGRSFTTPLPTPKQNGIVLKMTSEGVNKRFTIHRSVQVQESQKQLYVVACMNQQVAFEAKVDMTNRFVASGVFPANLIPSGIMTVTVFDNNLQPLAERITFVNNRDFEFDGDVFLSERSLTKRGRNTVEVMISDTIPSNLSLSITDADLQAHNPMEDNIVTRLLLTGELRGKITNPYSLFRNSDSASLFMDLVMLTHGWRRYNWDGVMAGKTRVPKWKENNFLSLSGQVVGLPQRSIGADLQLMSILVTADSAKNLLLLPVDQKANVFADGLVFYDQAKLYFNANTKKLHIDNSMLRLDNGLYKGTRTAAIDTTLNKTIAEISRSAVAQNQTIIQMGHDAKQSYKSITLKNVTVTARGKTPIEKMEDNYVSGLFSGFGRGYDLINDPFASSYTDVLQYLQGKVAGLQINRGPNPNLSWRGGTPALYLNEMLTDVSMISMTPVSDIAFIKVFRPGESIVMGGGGGVIAIYTRKGNDIMPDNNRKGMQSITITGYSTVKEFYSPDYARVADNPTMGDYRTTLYWNPVIYLDKSKRRFRVSFYNNDVTKRFRLVLEGINAEGKMIHIEKLVPSQWE